MPLIIFFMSMMGNDPEENELYYWTRNIKWFCRVTMPMYNFGEGLYAILL